MWYVYILECEDGSLYTGVTTDIERRFQEHKRGVGAKYTASHKAQKLVFSEAHESQSNACVREAHIKRMSRTQKLLLVRSTVN